VKVTPLAPAMGAEITGIDLGGIDLGGDGLGGDGLGGDEFPAGLIAEIRAVWLDYHMVVIRNQGLAPARQLALAKAIGTPDIYPFLDGLDEFPEITSVLKRETETVNFGGVWHTDTIYQDNPPMATMLQAIELPPIGGDTLFANQHLAWEQLSDGMKETLAGLRVICTAGKSKVAASGTARVAEKGKGVDAQAMEASHPVVRTHPETGRKSLYLSPGHAIRFEGWTAAESAGLLAFLFEHQIAPEFQCRLSWAVGDIALWDNRSTLHYPLNDYHGHRRLLHRITLKGDRPV